MLSRKVPWKYKETYAEILYIPFYKTAWVHNWESEVVRKTYQCPSQRWSCWRWGLLCPRARCTLHAWSPGGAPACPRAPWVGGAPSPACCWRREMCTLQSEQRAAIRNQVCIRGSGIETALGDRPKCTNLRIPIIIDIHKKQMSITHDILGDVWEAL